MLWAWLYRGGALTWFKCVTGLHFPLCMYRQACFSDVFLVCGRSPGSHLENLHTPPLALRGLRDDLSEKESGAGIPLLLMPESGGDQDHSESRK